MPHSGVEWVINQSIIGLALCARPGQASALDIIMLQRENRRIQTACHEIRRTIKNFVKAPCYMEH